MAAPTLPVPSMIPVTVDSASLSPLRAGYTEMQKLLHMKMAGTSIQYICSHQHRPMLKSIPVANKKLPGYTVHTIQSTSSYLPAFPGQQKLLN